MAARRILLVDDDDDLRQLFRRCLEAHGLFEVICAASGEEALALSARQAPELVLLDLCMPGLDGVATLARLRARPETALVPAVLMTAAGGGPIPDRHLWAGVLEKPFDALGLPGELLRILEGANSGGGG
jgi:CheY-like chemotaxis protein